MVCIVVMLAHDGSRGPGRTPSRPPAESIGPRTLRPRSWLAAAVLASAVLLAPRLSLASAPYKEVTVRDGGTVRGKVSFAGSLPKDAVERFPIPGKSEGCGRGYREVVHVDVEAGALRGTFVLLDRVAEGKAWKEQAQPQVLDQKDCRFVPGLMIVRSGERVTVRNSDPGVLHNINVRELIEFSSGRTAQRMMFNIAQPVPGEIRKTVKPKKSPFLTVGCDLHNFMISHVLAPEHPYAVIVDAEGRFVLEDVPAGSYTLVAWHPRLGKRKVEVTVAPKGAVEADLEFGQ